MTLEAFFQDVPKAAAAFSGGTDSALLVWAARQYGCDVRAYYVKTAFQPEFEHRDALRLARELDVSLVELIQGERTASPTLSKEEAGQVVAQAMDHSQKVTARRYLRLLRWLLIVMAMAAAYNPAVSLVSLIALHVFAPQTGVIGGADGPTQVLVSSTEGDWIVPILLAACAAIAMTCLILAIRVWRLEKKLK